MMCRHIATTTTWKAATTRTGGKPIKSHEGGVVVVQRGGGGGVKYEHSRVNRHRCNDDDIDGQRHSADDDDGPFGLFPECFRNNTSKRTRSSYITTVCCPSIQLNIMMMTKMITIIGIDMV